MNIGIIDVDGHINKKSSAKKVFPNIALMKLSAYHKNMGDSVEWVNPLKQYDVVYQSKVFDFTPDIDFTPMAAMVIKGGTGYDIKSLLPTAVENLYPDYSIYDISDTAYGFLTRGCPRGCEFCIVAPKEGRHSYQVANLSNFWNGQKYIELLDPNMLGCKNKMELLQQLVDSKAWVNFNQGLDIRFMTAETAELIKKVKVKLVHFAWDKYEDGAVITEKLKEFKEITQLNRRRLIVYVLVNFNTTLEQDLERIYKIRDLGCDPYVMIYNKVNAPLEIKRLARWVNNRFIWAKCKTFEEYGG